MLELPKHEASLTLCHNEHKNYYLTVEKAVESGDHGYCDWVSEEQKKKAIETDDCWYCQWYPDTPIGFYVMAAADLDVLLEHISSGKVE